MRVPRLLDPEQRKKIRRHKFSRRVRTSTLGMKTIAAQFILKAGSEKMIEASGSPKREMKPRRVIGTGGFGST